MPKPLQPEHVQKRSDLKSLSVVVAHVAFVLLPLYLAAATGLNGLLIVYWLWFGLTAHGLLNMMHECAHYHVFKERRNSDLLGRWVLGPLAVADFDNYRQLHWAHHRNLGGDADPKYSYREGIRGWRLLVLFLRCLVGVEAARKLLYQSRQRASSELATSRLWLVRVSLFHGALAGSLLATAWYCGPNNTSAALARMGVAYAFVYLYGLVSLTLFVATLRAIAEHQNGADHPNLSGKAALRNLTCGPAARLIFGCYGFAEHATHHIQPAIPSYRLSAATSELEIDSPWLRPSLSYIDVLVALTRAR